MDFALYLKDVSKKPSPSGAWLTEGHKITKEDLKYARNGIEHITFEEAAHGAGARGPKPEYRGWTPKIEGGQYGKKASAVKKSLNTGSEGPKMQFGKYKEKTMEWVRDNDPSYWEWCLESINWFPAKAEKAGL